MGLKQTTSVILLPNPTQASVAAAGIAAAFGLSQSAAEGASALLSGERRLVPVRLDIVVGLTIELGGEVFEHPVEGSDTVLTDDVMLSRPVLSVDAVLSNAKLPETTGDSMVDAQLAEAEQLADQGNGERAIGMLLLLQNIREAKAACTVLTSMNSRPLRNYLLPQLTLNRTPESGETINVSLVLKPRDVVRTQTTAAVADADTQLLGSQLVEIGF